MKNSQHLENLQEATVSLITVLDELRSSNRPETSSDQETDVYTFSSKELILYALGGMQQISVLGYANFKKYFSWNIS